MKAVCECGKFVNGGGHLEWPWLLHAHLVHVEHEREGVRRLAIDVSKQPRAARVHSEAVDILAAAAARH